MEWDFRRLRDLYGDAGAREKFEFVCLEVLDRLYPHKQVHRIQPNPGDDGVDIAIGSLEDPHGVMVCQCKFFIAPLGASQRRQIQSSLARAQKNFTLGKWVLCIPKDPTTKERRWWDSWSSGTGVDCELMCASNLLSLLREYGLYDSTFDPHGTARPRELMYHAIAAGSITYGPTMRSDEAEYLYYRMSGSSDVVLSVVEAGLNVRGADFEHVVQYVCGEVREADGPVFLMAEGGSGKSTLLAACAFHASDYDDVLHVDFADNEGVGFEALSELIGRCLRARETDLLLCIENPTARCDLLSALYTDMSNRKEAYEHVGVLVAERYDRMMTELLSGADHAYVYWMARSMSLVLAREGEPFVETGDARFFRACNVRSVCVTDSLRHAVIDRMIERYSGNPPLDGECVAEAREGLDYSGRAIADVFLDFQRRYNEAAKASVVTKARIEWDWDTWRKRTEEVSCDGIPVKDAFKYMAALETVGVAPTTKLLQSLCGLRDPLVLEEVFERTLCLPVVIDDGVVRFRHDTVANNYFVVCQALSIMRCLEALLEEGRMDVDTLVEFERKALATRHVIDPSLLPADVDVPKLYRLLVGIPGRRDALVERGRALSLAKTGVVVRALSTDPSQGAAFREECARGVESDLLPVIEGEGALRVKVGHWFSCFMFCLTYCDNLPSGMLRAFDGDGPFYKIATSFLDSLHHSLMRKEDEGRYLKFLGFAVEVYERILQDHPDDSLSQGALAESRLQLGDCDGAESAARKLAELNAGREAKSALKAVSVLWGVARRLTEKQLQPERVHMINDLIVELFDIMEQDGLADEEWVSLKCQYARYQALVNHDYEGCYRALASIQDGMARSYRKYVELGILCNKRNAANPYFNNRESLDYLRIAEAMVANQETQEKETLLSLYGPMQQTLYYLKKYNECLEYCHKALALKKRDRHALKYKRLAEAKLGDGKPPAPDSTYPR